VSQTVKDLVAGSGFTFADAGEPGLKGVPHRYRLYAVTQPGDIEPRRSAGFAGRSGWNRAR